MLRKVMISKLIQAADQTSIKQDHRRLFYYLRKKSNRLKTEIFLFTSTMRIGEIKMLLCILFEKNIIIDICKWCKWRFNDLYTEKFENEENIKQKHNLGFVQRMGHFPTSW